MRIYNKENYYNFYIEFNRIEEYNKYCIEWLNYYNIKVDNITNKTDWKMTDIPDVKDLNRIKGNINKILTVLGEGTPLLINTQVNQVWNVEKAQQIENSLQMYLEYLGNWQFQNNVCGLTICGNDSRLGGIS